MPNQFSTYALECLKGIEFYAKEARRSLEDQDGGPKPFPDTRDDALHYATKSPSRFSTLRPRSETSDPIRFTPNEERFLSDLVQTYGVEIEIRRRRHGASSSPASPASGRRKAKAATNARVGTRSSAGTRAKPKKGGK